MELGKQNMAENTKTTASKPTQKTKNTGSTATPRILKKQKYSSFKLHKKIKPTQPKIGTAITYFKKSVSHIKQNWKIFGGITLVYIVLTVLLVRGFGSTTDITDLKEIFSELYSGEFGAIITAGSIFGFIVTSSNATTSSEASVYQSLVLLLVSLASIWALRQTMSHTSIRVRDAFYKGMYPLVPFLGVLFVIGLQLIPIALAGWLYGIVIAGGVATTGLEIGISIILLFLLALLSLYMITSSIFALFIVALPDMTPIKALRSARQLVLHRRWVVLRKLLVLPLFLLIIAALIMLPILIWAAAIAEWVYLFISLFGWVLCVTYLYCIYRDLLND
jgi:hypothetical protein